MSSCTSEPQSGGAMRRANRQALRAVLTDTRFVLSRPASTRCVFRLVAAMGYLVNRRRLDHLLATGRFQPPRKLWGRYFVWTEEDILRFVELLEPQASRAGDESL